MWGLSKIPFPKTILAPALGKSCANSKTTVSVHMSFHLHVFVGVYVYVQTTITNGEFKKQHGRNSWLREVDVASPVLRAFRLARSLRGARADV